VIHVLQWHVLWAFEVIVSEAGIDVFAKQVLITVVGFVTDKPALQGQHHWTG